MQYVSRFERYSNFFNINFSNATTVRNWIHVILLTAAVGAVIGAIIGSLDSCNDEIRNVTVTRSVLRNVTRVRNVSTTVEIVNHLDAIVLIDGSGSMCYNSANTEGCTSGTCPADASSYCATYEFDFFLSLSLSNKKINTTD